MLVEIVLHFSNIRTRNLESFWPIESILFLKLFIYLWGSASVFITLIITYLIKSYDQSHSLLKIIGGFTLFHALVLVYLSRINYNQILPVPNTVVWIPHYYLWLQLEAFCLMGFTAIVMYGVHKNYLK